MLNGKSVLITGGTGSFGKAFVKETLLNYPDIKRLVIFSRDELKQFEMSEEFSVKEFPCLRYFIGDIRDKDRLKRAFEDIDFVVHAAALKQVPTAEYNPTEVIKTNILGSQNIVDVSLDMGIKKVVALSTDKAAAPVNLYGATKLCSDKLFVAANNYKGSRDITLSIVRYGNVMGSRGSVIPYFLSKSDEGIIPITDPEMTRFNILLEEGVKMVFWALKNSLGGEIFVPKIPSYRVTDVAKAIAPSLPVKIIGIRPGEKIHEAMITESDSHTTVDIGDYYVILPLEGKVNISNYSNFMKSNPVKKGFSYESGSNKDFLTVEEIRSLIQNHLYVDFEPI